MNKTTPAMKPWYFKRSLIDNTPIKIAQGPIRANTPPKAMKKTRAGIPTRITRTSIHQAVIVALGFAETGMVAAGTAISYLCAAVFSIMDKLDIRYLYLHRFFPT